MTPRDDTTFPSGFAPGQTIAGKFRIERVLGTGGMGIVLEAINIQLDQRVALKFLRQDIERSPAVVARFEREIRSAVKLRSEHVARVSDVGTHADYGPFMVMELLEGSTLAALVGTGPLPFHRAAEYVIHACEGLAEAHVLGIVHQDVKPANLFLVQGNDGRPLLKVLDFGISKATLGEPRSIETATTGRSGSNMGTPHYLSPEQLRASRDVDLRADVWALGCVLFELVTGTKAFEAKRFTELVAKILEAPRAAVPADLEVPAGLVEVIDRCLEKERERRYANSAELALALLPFARRRAHSVASHAVAHVADGGLDPHLAMPSSMPPRSSDDIDTLESSPSLRAPGVATVSLTDSYEPPAPPAPSTAVEPSASPKRPVLLIAVLACIALGALALLLMRHRGEPAASAVATPIPSVAPMASPAAPTPSAIPIEAPPVTALATPPPASANASASASAPAVFSASTPSHVGGRYVPTRRSAPPGASPGAPPRLAPAPPDNDILRSR